jgi:hypothetical protein
MNPRQKSYDSYDKTNKLLKLTNSYYHFRNLEFIKKRKPQYGNCPTFYQKSKNYTSPFQNHFIQKQNENIQNKLNQIRWRPIKPKINETFLVKESKIQAFRKQHKNISLKIRDEENEKYKRRIKNQKAFINPKLMDKDYKEEHTKTLMKLKKIADNDNIVLPSIKNSYDNPTLMESKKYYYNTESVIKNGRDYDSNKKRIKTGDEDESRTRSFNGSRYASGSNSVDK